MAICKETLQLGTLTEFMKGVGDCSVVTWYMQPGVILFSSEKIK